MIRNLLDIIDNVTPLHEGVGLANRKAGEQFKNHVGDIVTFQSVEFYPPSGKFPPDDTMADTITDLKQSGMNIHWVNQAAANSGGFMIATFTGENGEPYYLGKFVKEVSPNRAQNNFAHNDIPGGFKFQSKAGQKENSGLKPSDWLTQYQNNTPQTILAQAIKAFGPDSAEANALQTFIEGDIPVEVARGNMNATAFRDYFAEVLQPIALVLGKNVGGNAAEASDIFFGPGQGYGDCTISFNNNTIGGLYDSLLVNPEGKQIKLSSKGKDGANASVTNLIKSVQELDKAPAGAKLRKTFAKEIAMLENINKLGHFGAPIAIAEEYGIIGPGDGKLVMALKNLGPNDDVSGILNKRLQALYNERKAKDVGRIIPIEHMIAAIAYKVADYVNENTRFGEAASTILNNAALVQMYTITSDNKDTIEIKELNAVYPSQTVTGVLLDATKAYMSTQGKGNFTFKILKNGARAQDVNDIDGMDSLEIEPSTDVSDPEQLDVATQRRSSVKAAGEPIEKLGTKQSLGRARQR
jgi:hypothetical protein